VLIILRHVWEFVVAVFRQWGALVTGGFIVGLIVFIEHASGRPIARQLFWIAVVTSLVVAVFLTWRKERLVVESLTSSRPDFFYEGAGSKITFEFETNPGTDQPKVKINFRLRFINKGPGTAYNLNSKIYACWINDVPRTAALADSPEPVVGRTRPDEAKSIGFSAWRDVREHSSISLPVDPRDILLILVEIRFRHVSEIDSPICENEPIWKLWDPRIPRAA
jgi:hypothetical protein